jgi:hypothetical protein
MFKVYLSRRQTKSMSSEFPIGDPTGGAAYREMRDPATAMAASAGANVVGSIIGGEASKSAAKTQSRAAANASAAQQRIATQAISDMQKMRAQQIIELQNAQTDAVNRGQRDRASAIQLLVDQRTDALARIYGSKDQALGVIDNQRQEALQTFQPYMQVGQQGVGAIGQQLPYFQQTFGPEQFRANLDPSYEFMKQQGLGAIRQGMNIGGGGSNIDRAATKFAEDYANTGYQNAYNRFTGQQQNIYNRLAGIAGIGQTATGQSAQTGLGYGNLGAQTGLGYESLGAQTGLGYGSQIANTGLGYDQMIGNQQLGYGQTMASFNQGTGANISNLATGMGTATAQGITGQAAAQAAGDVGQANIYSGALGNLGQLGTQYAMYNTPGVQKALQIGQYAPQTGSTPISGGASSTGLPLGGSSSIMVGGSPVYTVP